MILQFLISVDRMLQFLSTELICSRLKLLRLILISLPSKLAAVHLFYRGIFLAMLAPGGRLFISASRG